MSRLSNLNRFIKNCEHQTRTPIGGVVFFSFTMVGKPYIDIYRKGVINLWQNLDSFKITLELICPD